MLYRLQTEDIDRQMRLDKFLARQLPQFSRETIRQIIDLGGVHLDGRRTRKSGTTLTNGQSLEVHRDSQPLEIFRISEADILFQDPYLIVLNKPAGIETQPTLARYKGTLYEALQVWLGRDRRFGRKLNIGMAQRLDRDTSGVIAFSIHPGSHKGFSEQIHNRSAHKSYLAMTAGTPEPATGTYSTLLARERRSNRMKSVEKGGKEAITHYRVLLSCSDFSLVNIELETGRTHQIRVHLSEAGHPLIGDHLYGGPATAGGYSFEHQCLHAYRLSIKHPVHNHPLSFTAPLPEEMLRIQAIERWLTSA